MKIFAAIILIMFLALSGYHLTFRSFKVPLIAKRFYLTGIEYLFLGLLLGPFFLNFLDSRTLKSLEPLSALLLGCIGLLCGFQVEIKELKRFPKSYLGAAVTESSITFLIVSILVFSLGSVYFTITKATLLIFAITLGALASCSAQTGLAILTAKTTNKRSDIILFLRYVSSINSIMAFLFFSPIFFLNNHKILKPAWFKPADFEFFTAVFANICLILLYNLFLAQKRNKNELLIVIIGMIVLTSGAASTLQFSPLLANFIMGVFLVNTTREKERIFALLINIEKPVYILLLVFIGAYWVPDSPIFILLAAAYYLIRLAGKLTGGFISSKTSHKLPDFQVNPGYGLIEQGGIPLAMLFDFQQNFPGEATTQIASIAIIALIISDLSSPLFIQKLIKKEGI